MIPLIYTLNKDEGFFKRKESIKTAIPEIKHGIAV
jgi:hypothetical protein